VGLKTDPTEQRGAQAGAEAPVAGEGLRRDDPAPEAAGVFKQPWLVVACLLLAASVVMLLLSHADAAFVCAALGVSAWFWNVRADLKRKHDLKKRGGRNWVQRGDDGDEED